MCFNITVMKSILTCCPNGTYYAKFGVWTRTIASQCEQLEKGAEVTSLVDLCYIGCQLCWLFMCAGR